MISAPAAVRFDAHRGELVLGGTIVQLQALQEIGRGGELRLGGAQGPVLRAASFAERTRAASWASTSAAPREALCASLVQACTVRDGEAERRVLELAALWLSGAGDEGPPFAATALRVAQAAGWDLSQIASTEAAEVDRLAASLGEPVTEPPWRRLLLTRDPSRELDELRDELADRLLARAVPFADETAARGAPLAQEKTAAPDALLAQEKTSAPGAPLAQESSAHAAPPSPPVPAASTPAFALSPVAPAAWPTAPSSSLATSAPLLATSLVASGAFVASAAAPIAPASTASPAVSTSSASPIAAETPRPHARPRLLALPAMPAPGASDAPPVERAAAPTLARPAIAPASRALHAVAAPVAHAPAIVASPAGRPAANAPLGTGDASASRALPSSPGTGGAPDAARPPSRSRSTDPWPVAAPSPAAMAASRIADAPPWPAAMMRSQAIAAARPTVAPVVEAAPRAVDAEDLAEALATLLDDEADLRGLAR